MNRQKALNQYRQVDTQSSVLQAAPHKLIQMLFQGVIDRVAMAKGCLQRNDFEGTGKYIRLAVGIIGGLQSSLELKLGGEVAQNLNDLYVYMQRRLLDAQIKKNPDMLEEVIRLIKEIKSAWDELPNILQKEKAKEPSLTQAVPPTTNQTEANKPYSEASPTIVIKA